MYHENKIKALRLEKSWSQEQLAEIASLNVKTIQRIENGAEPSLETLSAIAAAFDIKVKDLIQEKEYKQSKIAEELVESAKVRLKREILFYKNIVVFIIIIPSLLIVINITTRSNIYWCVYPITTMLVFLIVRGVKVFVFKNKINDWKRKRLKNILREYRGC